MKQKLVIDRTKWLRGEGADVSSLLRPSDGKMCCVGFYCLALGKTPSQITGIGWPNGGWPNIPDWLTDVQTDYTPLKSLAHVNDSPTLSDTDRESRLTELFAQHDVELEFIN